MITLKMGEVPEVPNTFHCPICGEKITLEIDEWTSDYDGWKASDAGVHTSCISEPDIMDDNYEAWMNHHFQYPYIDWLPVDRKIYDWLEDNYRFTETPSNNPCAGQVAGAGKSDGERRLIWKNLHSKK